MITFEVAVSVTTGEALFAWACLLAAAWFAGLMWLALTSDP